jgi:hypothetical protein
VRPQGASTGPHGGVPRGIALPAALLAASVLGALLPASLPGAPPASRATLSAGLGGSSISRATRAAAQGTTGAPGPALGPTVLTLHPRYLGPPVPADFLGLSFEAAEVPRLALFRPGGELDTILRSLGTGVMRLGGVSADKTAAWVPERAQAPSWASTTISPGDVTRVAELAREAGWSTLWTLNLGHYEPARAAREAAAVRTSFGQDLLGLEVGNEPNAYAKEGLRGSSWGLSSWLGQFESYRSAIARGAPRAPVAAPDAASGVPQLTWVSAAAGSHPHLLTDHFYPLTSCGYQRPSIAELLGVAVREEETTMLTRLQSLAGAYTTPLRIDETNDISCHGEAGVSDSFASSLWAADWILRAMGVGVAGMNFHDLLDQPSAYSPLVLRHGGLHANPEWYALLLTAPLVGERPVRDVPAGDPNLTIAAFVGRGRPLHPLSVVLVDFDSRGSRARAVRLHVPMRYTAGSVLRLTAPSPAARSQVTLGGAEVGPDGAWQPRLPLPRVPVRHGAFTLEIPPGSAALVTLTGH